MSPGRPAAGWQALANRPGLVLVVVAGAFLLTQLLVVDLDRFFGWDESIYLAEAFPDRPSIGWDAHRARGVPLLVAPVTPVAAPGPVVRGYMAAATALLVLLAYAAWLRTIGWGAVWGAAAFAFSWLALAQGHEVLPNLPAALCAVGVAGAFVGRVLGGRTAASAVAVVGFGCALALLRPTETVPLAAVLAAAGVWWTRTGRSPASPPGRARRLAEELALLGAGFALGWAQWTVEAVTTFGGPRQRLEAAAAVLPGPPDSPLAVLWAYAGMLGGPLARPGDAALWPVALWGALLLAGCALAVVVRRQPERSVGVTCLVASVALLAWYLVYDWIEVRFLAPAWALASVAVGLGLSRVRLVFRGDRAGAGAVAVLAAAGVVLVPWHVGIADEVASYQTQVAESDRAVAAAMRGLAEGQPCAFYADDGVPQLEFASGCRGTWLTGSETQQSAGVGEQRAAGIRVFVALRNDQPAGWPLAGWRARTVPALHGPDWTLHVPPERAG